MTYPRSLLICPGAAGVFHCVSRCVRRAFLCGVDRASGRSFEHRRQWIEDRALALCELFAVSLHAYAVMSNHFHLVVELVPDEAMAWTESDIAHRWVRLFPVRGANAETDELRIQALLANPERIVTPTRHLKGEPPDLADRLRHSVKNLRVLLDEKSHAVGTFDLLVSHKRQDDIALWLPSTMLDVR